jgi:bile acid:Na+ symporter, BASS family
MKPSFHRLFASSSNLNALMKKILRILRNRDFLLISAIALGLAWGDGAKATEKAVLPVLALVMTLSVMGVPGSVFRSPKALIVPALAGLFLNYGLLGGLLLGLNYTLIRDETLRAGFVIMAAVPPAVAVIPFTFLLNGDSPFSLVATIGCYLGALVIMPLITLTLLGEGFADSRKLVMIMLELIFIPLVISRILRWSGAVKKLDSWKGTLTNWSFTLVTYTIVGLNRNLFLSQPFLIAPVAFIALASTFLLGFGIERVGRLLGVGREKRISLVLLGTHKNTGLAAGLALTLFSDKTALPATVSTIFMIVYLIWLSLKGRRGELPA